MEKLSGLVLDASDDDGTVLRSIFPTRESVSEFIKQANVDYLRSPARDQLPDDLFALVLHDGDVTLRKFACADAGHTALSVEYFLKTAHKLPEEAQKVAASNLCTACGWYGIEPPETLQKIAFGLMRAANLAIMTPMAAKQTSEGLHKNLSAARASGGRVNPNVLGSAPPPVVQGTLE